MMYLLKLIIPYIATNSYYKITKFDKKIKPCKAFGVLGCQTSEIVAVTEDASHVCIPMKKGTDSDTLRESVNKAIKELREEGILSELSVKYFGSDITNP